MKRTFENPVFGDKATIIKSADETNGEYSLLEVEVAPGGANSPHLHTSFSEKFLILEGELEVQIEKKKHILKQGDCAIVPNHAAHYFINRSTTAVKFQVELRPAQAGFERALAIAYGLATDGKVNKKGIPKKISHLCLLTVMSGTIPAGLFKVFLPLFRLIAKHSQKMEATLISKYC